jgi:hypothetical protein
MQGQFEVARIRILAKQTKECANSNSIGEGMTYEQSDKKAK